MESESVIKVLIVLVVLLIVSLIPHGYAWYKKRSATNSTMISTITLANPALHLSLREFQIFDKDGKQLAPYKDFHFYQSMAYNAGAPASLSFNFMFDGATTGAANTNSITSTADTEKFIRVILDTPQELGSIKLTNASGILYSKESAAYLAGATLSAFNQAGVLIKSWTCTADAEQTFAFA